MATVGGLILPYGVFTSSATDATVSGAGQGISIDRVWSSGADGVEGGFGRGWMSVFDARVVTTASPAGQIATVTFLDGRQESFGKNSDGTWASSGALGTTDRFAVDGSGTMTVRETSGTIDVFNGNGDLTAVNFGDSSWQITRAGSRGDISLITQMPSGRALQVSWASNVADSCSGAPTSTRPHVSSISTPGDNRSTWTYTYKCSRLTSVTDPEGGVTHYTTGASSFAGTTPNGAPLPGLTSLGTWTYPAPYVRQRTVTLTVPGSVGRKVTLMESAGDGYANAINSYNGPVATYCEFRSISNGAEACPQSQTRIRFDTTNRAVVKQVSAPGAAQTPTNSRNWLYSVTDGQLMGFTDENGNTVGYSYDANGNPEGTYVYRDANTQVTSSTFFRSPTSTDPQYRIAGTAVSPTQAGVWRADMFSYDATGHLTQRVGSATPAAASGEITTFGYSGPTSPAYDASGQKVSGATAPSGLLTSESVGGGTSAYQYAANGDLVRFIPVGHGATSRSYDVRGQVSAEATSTSAGIASTSFIRDGRGRTIEQDDPCVTNPVTGSTVRKLTLSSYNKDGLVVKVVERAVDCGSGGTVADDRVTSFEYDSFDRLIKTTGPTGAVTSLTYDSANPAQVTHVTDARGRTFDYTYSTFTGEVASETSDIDIAGTRVRQLTHSYQYDPAGRLVAESDALGRVTAYTYTGDNLVKTKVRKNVSNTRGKPARDVEMWRGTYDGRGNLTSETIGGSRRTDYVYDSEGRLQSTIVDPNGLNRTTTVSRDAQGRLIGVSFSDGTRTESVSYAVDAAGNPTSAMVENGATDIKSLFFRDVNELLTGTVDPGVVGTSREQAGTTAISYDLLGRMSDLTGPLVDAATPSNTQTFTGLATTAVRARTVLGYDAFGELTEIKDPAGQITRVRYDAAGHKVATIRPDYTPPGASTPVRGEIDDAYNPAGDLTSSTDERGTTTRFTFDVAGNKIRDEIDLGGGHKRTTVTAFTAGGEVRAVTSPGGATTSYFYDELGRLVQQGRTQLEDSCCFDGGAWDPTVLEYDDAGNLTDLWSHGINGEGPRSMYYPAGAHTHYTYNAAGEIISRSDPGVGNSFLFVRDLKGRITAETQPNGVRIEHVFDLAGREISTTRVGTDGARQTTTYGFDADGRVVSESRPNGQQRTSTYDLAGRLTRFTEQLTATTTRNMAQSFDVAGRVVRTQDAGNHLTWQTYNTWGLVEKTIAPASTGATALRDRTWQYAYESGGQVATQTSPGGAVQQNTYDAVGQLTNVNAYDPTDPSALVNRTISYTSAGDIATIDTPNGTENFTWGSWGQLLSARGPSMNADYSYDDNRRLSSESRLSPAANNVTAALSRYYDPAGRISGTWASSNGQSLSRQSEFDAATGRLAAEKYTTTSASSDVTFGRTSFGYDSFGRKNSETVSKSTSAQIVKTDYAFDSMDNLLSKTVSGQSIPDGGTYQYDLASRLISWQPNAPPGGGSAPAATTYTWDAANNRTSSDDGTTKQTWTYDQRDRITGSVSTTSGSSPTTTSIASNARGDVTAIGSRSLTYDALDELTSDSGVRFAYDSLGRLASRSDQTLQYDGLAGDPSGTTGGSAANEMTVNGRDGEATLSWNLTNRTAGALIANDHSDAVGRLDTAGTFAAATSYDPFGNRSSGSSTAGATTYLGYQGDWTDPTTGGVRMGARWYEPSLGRFLSRDTANLPFTNGGATSLFTYANANPLSNVDPSGHDAFGLGWIPDAVGKLVTGGEGLEEGLADWAIGLAGKGVAFDQAVWRGIGSAAGVASRAGAAALGAVETAAAGAGELAAGDLLVDAGMIAAPEIAIGVGVIFGAAWVIDALTAPRAAPVPDPVPVSVPVAAAPALPHSLTARSVSVSVQPRAYASTRSVSVSNGVRTTTETFWGSQLVDLYETFADNTWHRNITSYRVITGQEWFSEPLVNPLRPGLALTQSSVSATVTPAVTTPSRALSTAAGSCGLGGTIAACQTPSLGAGLCGSISATSSLCMPAEPLPGRAGGVQANTPHQNGGDVGGAAKGTGGGGTAPPEGCPPQLSLLGLCGGDSASASSTRGGTEGATREAQSADTGKTAPVNGETSATAYGRLMHSTYDYGPEFDTEVSLQAGGRVDAINFETREVLELKPNNPRAIRLGERQLKGYIAKLNEEFPGDPWTGQVVTYNRP